MDGSHSFPVVIVMRSIYNGDFNMTETLSWLLAETRLQAKKNCNTIPYSQKHFYHLHSYVDM